MPTSKKDGRRRLKDWLTLGLRACKSSMHRGCKLTQTSLAKLLKRRELAMAIRGCAPIRFCQLESRRVLNASFDLIGANLQLSNFANGTNLEVTHSNLGNSYQFTLNSGTWFDNLGADTGSNVLSVMDSVLNGNLSVSSTVATNVLLSGDLGTLNQVTINTLGQVTDAVGTQLQTMSLLSIKSSNATLGEQATDLYQVGQLSLDTSGSTELHASGNLDVLMAKSSGSIKLFADSLQLRSIDTQSNFDAQATTGDILIGSVSATIDINLMSIQGSILDAQDDSTVDLTAGGTITLTASQSIQALGATDTFLEVADGSKVNAKSLVAGDIQLVGLGSVELTQASTADGSIAVRSVGTLTALDVDASMTDSIGNDVHLRTLGLNSDLIAHRVVSGINNGHVSLTASRNIVDGDVLVDDLDVIAHATELQALAGWVGAQAGLNTDIFTESYQADTGLEVRWLNQLSATAGVSIVLNPDNGAGSLALDAPTAVLVSNGDVNTANVDYSLVSNLALIADADNNSIGTVRLAGTTSVSGDLRVQGADVTSIAALNFQATRMFLASGQAEQFSVNNLNANSPVDLDGLTVGDMTVTSQGSLRLLDLDASGNSLQSTLGSVLVSSSAGDVTVLASVQASQNILLHAGEDLIVSAGLQTTSGHITLLADDDITLNSRIATTVGGTVCIEADNQSADAISGILMSNNSSINTTNSDVRMVAANEGSISVQKIDVGQGRVSLIAEGSILASSASHTISASELRLEADAQILNPSNSLGSIGQPSPTNGSPSNNGLAIHTQVTVIAAVSASGHYLVNDGSVRIDSINPIVVQCVNLDGSLTQRTDASLADLTSTGNGSIKLQTRGGEIRVNDGSQTARLGSNGRGVGALGSGDILLQATGNNAGVSINSTIVSQSGAINIVAALGIQQQSDITVLAPVSPVRGSILLQSLGGDINMSGTAVTSSNGSNIVYGATGNINLGRLNAGQGSIAIDAGASVMDGQNDLVTANIVGFSNQTGQTRVVNVEALSASIRSVDGIGQSRNPLDLSVSFVAAHSSGNVYLYESDSIEVAAISAIEATQVYLNSTMATGRFGNLAGITSTGGHVKLESIAGELKVQNAVSARQDLLLAAAGGSIQLDANAQATQGAIQLLAQQSIQQNANLTVTTGNDPIRNSITAQAVTGVATMAAGATSRTAGGNIAYLAADDVTVGVLSAGSGSVYINSGGSILDAQADTVGHSGLGFATVASRTENLIASAARLVATGSIGVNGNPLDTKLDSVAVQSGLDSQILNTAALQVTAVPVISTTEVQLVSTTRTLNSNTNSGAISGANLRFETLAGELRVTAQVQADRNVQLATQDRISIDANVTSQFGSISLLANNQIQQNANLFVQGSRSLANSILVQSLSDSIVMAPTAQSTSSAGSIVYKAATTISIGQIIAPLGVVSIDAVGAILDSQADTTQLDLLTGFATQTGLPRTENIVADDLILRAASIGALNNSLDINVQSMAVDSLGDIAMLETNSVAIGSVSQIQATLSHHDSTNQTVTSPGLSGLRSHNGEVRLQSLNGNLVVSNAADVGSVAGQSRGVAASGNVLLAAGGIGNLVIQSSVLSERTDVWLAAGALLVSPPNSPASDQTAIVEGDHLTLFAGTNVFLPNVLVNSFEAKITAAQNVIPSTMFLNQLANQAGTLILNDLQHGPTQNNPNITTPDTPILTTSFQSWIDQFQFTERFADGYSLLLRNHNPLLATQKNFDRTLNVQGQAPGVYIETLDPSGAAVVSDLTVAGQVDLASTLVGRDPGIVLIADGNLVLPGSVNLVTPLTAALPKTQSLNTLDLNAKAYNAGEGDPRFLSPQNHNIPATTEYVVDPLRSQTEDYRTHVLQRVLMEFGSAGESGFMSLVHYADNGFQVFQNQGQVSTLTPGSEYQLQSPSNDLRAITNTTAEAALFTRAADFGQIERFFLQNNRDLPTDVVIRRSLDYFLFSNAQSGDATQIVDHASYSQDVLEVKSLGTSSMGPITPIPDPIAPPPPPTRCETPQPERPLTLILPQVELRQVKSEAIEVAIFQISYDDRNHNGQVENNELPEFDDVLNRVDEDSKLPVESKNAGQSPTQGEIDEVKSKLLDTPDQPSGAYAIIRKNADGKQEVLEVFSVRDWPEGTDPSDDKESMDQTDSGGGTQINKPAVVPETDASRDALPAPAKVNVERLNQGASNHSDEQLTPAEKIELVSVVQEVSSTGHLEQHAGVVAALMLLHRSPNSKVQSSACDSPSESNTKSNPSFLRNDRRQRRIRRLIEKLTDSSPQDI